MLDDGSADWASAFATAGGRPPPPATLAIDLSPAASRSAREASFARLAAEARLEAVLRADEGVLTAAFANLKQDKNNEGATASIDAFRDVAVRRLGLSSNAFERKLRRARVAAVAAVAAGLSVGGGNNGGGGGGGSGELSYAQFRAALLADG